MVYTKIQHSEVADKLFQYAHTEQLSPKPAHRLQWLDLYHITQMTGAETKAILNGKWVWGWG